MQLWLRLLIVWFIALALPVQGIAGVTMVNCGQSHERLGAARAAMAEPGSHRHAEREAGAAHHHLAAAAHSEDHAGHATVAPADAPSDHVVQSGEHTCSSCASCCAGAALPSLALRLPDPVCAPTVFAETMVSVDTFASDGPDRPPRCVLA
jgi:hypothetical protein